MPPKRQPLGMKGRPEVLAFLQKIHENPDDDAPRLMLADWLKEHGEYDRGEFVRLQVEAARLREDDPMRRVYALQANALWKAHGASGWATDLPYTTPGERGLLQVYATRNTGTLASPSKLAATEGWAWVDALRLRQPTWQAVKSFLSGSLLDGLRSLEISGQDRTILHQLVHSGRDRKPGPLPQLRRLRVDLWSDSGETLRAFSDWPVLRTVDSLDAPTSGVANSLSGSPHLQNLRWLRIHIGDAAQMAALGEALANSRVSELVVYGSGSEVLRVLAGSRLLLQLQRLELESDGRGMGHDIAALAASPGLRNLRSLNLRHLSLDPGQIGVLLSSPHLANLKDLVLSTSVSGTLGTDGVFPTLVSATHFSRLEQLELGGGPPSLAAIKSLAGWGGLASLTHLTLPFTELSDEAVRRLVASPHLTRLRYLDLSNNQIGNEGARALANWPGSGDLVFLDLSGNHITDDGARLLLSSPCLCHLAGLNLADNRISHPDRLPRDKAPVLLT